MVLCMLGAFNRVITSKDLEKFPSLPPTSALSHLVPSALLSHLVPSALSHLQATRLLEGQVESLSPSSPNHLMITSIISL